ncbi:MAG: DUF5320 domain-containing protein [Anaerolineae bacterium]
MPGFDGTGPRGLGPFTGRGEGYCAVTLPAGGAARVPRGYAGIQGVPLGAWARPRFLGARLRLPPMARGGRGLGRRGGLRGRRW